MSYKKVNELCQKICEPVLTISCDPSCPCPCNVSVSQPSAQYQTQLQPEYLIDLTVNVNIDGVPKGSTKIRQLGPVQKEQLPEKVLYQQEEDEIPININRKKVKVPLPLEKKPVETESIQKPVVVRKTINVPITVDLVEESAAEITAKPLSRKAELEPTGTEAVKEVKAAKTVQPLPKTAKIQIEAEEQRPPDINKLSKELSKLEEKIGNIRHECNSINRSKFLEDENILKSNLEHHEEDLNQILLRLDEIDLPALRSRRKILIRRIENIFDCIEQVRRKKHIVHLEPQTLQEYHRHPYELRNQSEIPEPVEKLQ